MKQKLIQVTRTIFAYGMAVLMVVTFLVALCYLSAFIVGLPMSEMICGIFSPMFISQGLHFVSWVCSICIFAKLMYFCWIPPQKRVAARIELWYTNHKL